MAEADDEPWGDVNEENIILGSEMLVNDDQFDQGSTSSATSYTNSVTNSPMAEAHSRPNAHHILE